MKTVKCRLFAYTNLLCIEFILGLFAEGWTEQQILESYPTLTAISLQAVFAFAADCLKEENGGTAPVGAARESGAG